MIKNRQHVLSLTKPFVNLTPINRARARLEANHTERAAEALTQRTRLVWHRLCDHLLVTRNRHDPAASDFEYILVICYRTLSQLSRKQSVLFHEHAANIKIYICLVRRFRREGVPGLAAALFEARNEQKSDQPLRRVDAFSATRLSSACSLVAR